MLILSHDNLLLQEGFEDTYSSGLYSKIISEDDLTSCCRIKTKAKLKGHTVNVYAENENAYCIGTSDASIAKELGLDRTDKYYYEKWVPKYEAVIFEERENNKY